MKEKKGNWTKPQLTVLIRGRIEEQVLTVCKGATTGPTKDWCSGNCAFPMTCVCNARNST